MLNTPIAIAMPEIMPVAIPEVALYKGQQTEQLPVPYLVLSSTTILVVVLSLEQGWGHLLGALRKIAMRDISTGVHMTIVCAIKEEAVQALDTGDTKSKISENYQTR